MCHILRRIFWYDYEISKSLEENDLNLNDIQRERYFSNKQN